jgi:hypothetical protein
MNPHCNLISATCDRRKATVHELDDGHDRIRVHDVELNAGALNGNAAGRAFAADLRARTKGGVAKFGVAITRWIGPALLKERAA